MKPKRKRPPHPGAAPSPAPAPRRRPYSPPALVEYGSIAARTLASATGSVPDAMRFMAMMCY